MARRSRANSSGEDGPSRLEQALTERDAALVELARVRAELDALKLAIRARNEPIPPAFPLHAGVVAPPRRYLVADAVHERLKGPLTWLQQLRGGREPR